MKTEYTPLHVEREHEMMDLADAWHQEQIAKKIPAHVERLRADPAQLTDAINEYLFDNDHMALLVEALLGRGIDSLMFHANLRELVLGELRRKAYDAAKKEVEAEA